MVCLYLILVCPAAGKHLYRIFSPGPVPITYGRLAEDANQVEDGIGVPAKRKAEAEVAAQAEMWKLPSAASLVSEVVH
ncbi:hypothetical protein C8F01DRAFT_1261057 [Mycena amicta]|nr:hypothetical protein C8F01DRAFT_1261057 [Mycena amicta]